MARNRRRLAWWILGTALAGVLLLTAFHGVGRWLVVADPLRKADAVVVFGGGMPFRAMEAAEIYRQGWAAEVWVPQGRSPEAQAAMELGIDYVPEHGYSRRVLEKLGVPPGAIRMLRPVTNTQEEVTAVLDRLRETGGKRVILVSSKAHTRRIQVTWRALAGPGVEAVVRYADKDPYEPGQWWATSRNALAVTREIGGILNAWAGFPLSSER